MDLQSTQPCTCPTCVSFCERAPCIPLPSELPALIAAGHAKRMMFHAPFGVVMPARKGCEGSVYVDQQPRQGCTFHVDGLCQLHAPGLKPYTGRVTDHSNMDQDVTTRAVLAWHTPDGARTIAEWGKASA